MSNSIKRVSMAAQIAGLPMEITHFESPAKTAKIAAELLGCETGQIANSLIFQAEHSGDLVLLITSGATRVDLTKAAEIIGEPIARADPKHVREHTGFAIGGVAPIGHLNPIRTWIEESLFAYEVVWAAAGRAECVFSTSPADLVKASNASVANFAQT